MHVQRHCCHNQAWVYSAIPIGETVFHLSICPLLMETADLSIHRCVVYLRENDNTLQYIDLAHYCNRELGEGQTMFYNTAHNFDTCMCRCGRPKPAVCSSSANAFVYQAQLTLCVRPRHRDDHCCVESTNYDRPNITIAQTRLHVVCATDCAAYLRVPHEWSKLALNLGILYGHVQFKYVLVETATSKAGHLQYVSTNHTPYVCLEKASNRTTYLRLETRLT